MKTKILALLILFISSGIVGQKKCKPFGTTKDKKTGKKIAYYGNYLTSRVSSQGIEWDAQIFLINDTEKKITYLQTVLLFPLIPTNYTTGDEKWFDIGTSFELVLENGEKLFFESTEAELKRTFGSRQNGFQAAPVSNEQIELLSSSRIVQFTISPFLNIEKLPLKKDLRKKKGEKLMNQFACFKKAGFENTGKVRNTRKGLTYMKLADKFLKGGKFDKAKSYYVKSIEEAKDIVILSKLNILNVFLKSEIEKNIETLNENLLIIRKNKGKTENLKILEDLTLSLIEKNPDMGELEEILLLIAN